MTDYYDTLGLSKGASADEIKKAYRKVAMRYHPDRNPGDKAAEAKFKEATTAYEILKDPQKKARYDQYGASAFENGGGHNPFGGGHGDFDFSDAFRGSGLGDIFEEMMGGGRRNQQRASGVRNGDDLKYDLQISLQEAYAGKEIDIKYHSYSACGSCKATGSADGKAGKVQCQTCHGTGKMRVQQGFFVIETTCNNCHGEGVVIKNPCRTCSGQGRVRQARNLRVSIPAGIEDGNKIRISGEGEAGLRGGKSGDLYVFVNIKRHEIFQRRGDDIICTVPITMVTLALGGEVEVPKIAGGYAMLKVPAGTQPDTQLRLRGQGMKLLNSSHYGDMYINIKVEIPVNLQSQQKILLGKFAETLQDNQSHPRTTGFFAKVKKFMQDLG